MKNDKLELKKVAIVAKLHAKEASSIVGTLSKWLGERGIEAVLEASLAIRCATSLVEVWFARATRSSWLMVMCLSGSP